MSYKQYRNKESKKVSDQAGWSPTLLVAVLNVMVEDVELGEFIEPDAMVLHSAICNAHVYTSLLS